MQLLALSNWEPASKIPSCLAWQVRINRPKISQSSRKKKRKKKYYGPTESQKKIRCFESEKLWLVESDSGMLDAIVPIQVIEGQTPDVRSPRNTEKPALPFPSSIQHTN